MAAFETSAGSNQARLEVLSDAFQDASYVVKIDTLQVFLYARMLLTRPHPGAPSPHMTWLHIGYDRAIKIALSTERAVIARLLECMGLDDFVVREHPERIHVSEIRWCSRRGTLHGSADIDVNGHLVARLHGESFNEGVSGAAENVLGMRCPEQRALVQLASDGVIRFPTHAAVHDAGISYSHAVNKVARKWVIYGHRPSGVLPSAKLLMLEEAVALQLECPPAVLEGLRRVHE
jgi:hypothetical protein